MELIYAYIDPGSGSLVIQALIAGIVAVPIFFRRQISRVISTLRRSDVPRVEDAAETATQDDTAERA